MNIPVQSIIKEDVAATWWRGATIYQVYPRSFADTNGDGVGDLPGITEKLDYIAALGVDAVWLSPFFTSPMKDFGYDVADYCDVDPIFGTLADFDALVTRAHALGLKILIDQVYSHTSDQHEWFAESRGSRDNPKGDWYVWADAKVDGSPPNNWQSVFGGPAWSWDARRGQYYMHNFLAQQPQLNVHNPEVQDALLGVAKFWLDRGVDGFRVDAINFAMHDLELRDNPPAPAGNGIRTRPFDFQLKVHNQSHPDIPKFVERIRNLTDQYPDRFTVAEVGGADPDREMKAFTAGESHFNSAYGFDFLYADKLTPALVREALENWPAEEGIGWPSWAFSNHDAPRWINRWAPDDARGPYARMAMLLFLCLRGNAIIWQGEELGLTQVEIPFDRLQDPEAIANWPLTLSRDGTRTPMPWQAEAPNCGFSSQTPWLPLGGDHVALAVDKQEESGRSMLQATRRFIALRQANEALRSGDIRVVDAQDPILAFERKSQHQTILCLFNMGGQSVHWEPNISEQWRTIEQLHAAGDWKIGPYGALVAERMI
ncbi:alpha-glucosidase [Sphingorhabdus sp.]|uniref:alpha-glucosidase n=1 Tax=Sphingorhabdus sp. TaxID=1902408 RepID=UPI0032B75BC6